MRVKRIWPAFAGSAKRAYSSWRRRLERRATPEPSDVARVLKKNRVALLSDLGDRQTQVVPRGSGGDLPAQMYALAVPMPGPSFVIITQASFGGGRLAGMIAAIGTTIGVATYATATPLGISALSAAVPWLVTIIQVLGGLYLVYLGIQALRAAITGEGGFATAKRPDERLSIARTFIKALLVSLGNPKMAAFFFGLFAPLVGPSHSSDARLLVLGGVVLIDLFYHQALATILVRLAASRPAKAAQRWLDALVGALMTAFGLRLLVEAVRSR